MKKNLAIALLLLLSSFGYNVNADNILGDTNKEYVITTRDAEWIVTIRLPDESKVKISKKDLKDEIKRRKKYHKSLLNIYNESFNHKYLELIAENSGKLSYLRELLKA